MTFLLFLKRIDEYQILEEKRSNDTGTEIRKTFFPNKLDQFGKPISEVSGNAKWKSLVSPGLISTGYDHRAAKDP